MRTVATAILTSVAGCRPKHQAQTGANQSGNAWASVTSSSPTLPNRLVRWGGQGESAWRTARSNSRRPSGPILAPA